MPDEYTELLERHAEFKALRTPARDRLTEAVVDGVDADLGLLRAAAIAETVASKAVDDHVQGAVRGRLRAIHDSVAADHYAEVARQFDVAAKAFQKAHSIVSCETDPAEIVTADEKTRKAYVDGQAAAQTLSRLTVLLGLAAELAGAERPNADQPASSRSHAIGIDQLQLGLCVDATGVHVRELWTAWEANGSQTATQWAALAELGVPIRATALEDYAPQRLPKQLLERRETVYDGEAVDNGNGTTFTPAARVITRIVDPEDELVPEWNDTEGSFKPVQPPQPVTATVAETH
ncbi:hypothetical protein [Mycolicibacterium farcinogenes]|uniref:Uncharacterized protein n=1 Tax=Mycolicibacterium farcinogenes TaxID=1802 RepID=A0ACD1F9X0_MYCFR|nr:hypothetical protein [Mycolicibacterium farcinogenes]QZH63817.1 hypothetical protein K6L26_17195 [Mycolicibacterium farcinogenes]